jgi:hypothetical protein
MATQMQKGWYVTEKSSMAESAREQRGLEVEVLRYFVEHPEAVDNLEGISGWRLLGSRLRSQVETAQRVLDVLVAQEFLQRIETQSGPLYRMNQQKLEEAEQELRQRKSQIEE